MQLSANGNAGWRTAAAHAIPVTALVAGLYTYWFAVADRYIVFLYYHDMGPRVPDTTPFSAVTSSRYWMAGLVAGGMVMMTYAAINWAVGRLAASYVPPAWARVWASSAIPLVIVLPAITMTVNSPTLPPLYAAQTTAAALAALAIALATGRMAARQPRELAWLGLDGLALAVVLLPGVFYYPLLAAGMEPEAAIRLTPVAAVVSTAFSLAVISLLRRWRRRPATSFGALIASGVAVAYLFLPLVHHILGTNGYYYITDSANFFAQGSHPALMWLAAAVLAWGAAWLRARPAAQDRSL